MTTRIGTTSTPRRQRVRLVAAALLTAAAMISACGSSEDGKPASAVDLAGQGYVLISATGVEIVGGSSITLEFEEESLAGSTGCNRIFGGYAIEEGRLVTSELATTKMACEPALMDQETWFLNLLSNSPTVALDQDQLLLGAEGVELVFDRV